MKRLGILALLLAPLLGGCDVALGVYFATRSGGSSKPDLRYHVFVKKITGGDETNQRGLLVTAGGKPGSQGWVEIGAATTTAEFALPSLASFNAILVMATVNQVYNFESVQLLNANRDVTVVASGTTYSNMISGSTVVNILGIPDGVAAITAADDANNAFIFTIWSLGDAPTKVRVNTWGTAPASGDVDDLQIQARSGIQRAGGAALKLDGSLYGIAKDDYGVRAVILLEYPPGGGIPTTVSLETEVRTAQGNNAIVIDQSTTPDSVYVGTTASDLTISGESGRIHIKNIEGPNAPWTQTVGTQGVCRIEAHGLALDSSGQLILAAGVDWGSTNGGLGPIIQKLSKTNGSQLWLPAPTRPEGAAPGPFDLNGDYYFGVATHGSDIWTTGTLQQTPPAGFREIYVERRSDSDGSLTWPDYADGASPLQTSPDRGNAVAADPDGNVYVGGFFVDSGSAQRAIILSYPGGQTPHTITPFFVSTTNSPAEILDVKADKVSGQTFIYATGYETVTVNSTTRQNLFVMKIASGGSVIWKRTYNGGFGDDRGVSLALDGTHVWVWGETTVAASDVDVFYLRLVK